MAATPVRVRSLYRRMLRELPTRTPSILANPSPLQKHIRADFASSEDANPTSESLKHQLLKPTQHRLREAEQYLQYLRAQRTYNHLIERYNTGMNMSEEEKIRLSARRVGMNLPVDYQQE